MKYLSSEPFTGGANSKAYQDGWERMFGNKKEDVTKTKKCPTCKGFGYFTDTHEFSFFRSDCFRCRGEGVISVKEE